MLNVYNQGLLDRNIFIENIDKFKPTKGRYLLYVI